MSDSYAVLAFLLGLALSLAASEVLVSALARLGLRLGMSAGLLGLLVALGADSPGGGAHAASGCDGGTYRLRTTGLRFENCSLT